jgi:hypothetical protein
VLCDEPHEKEIKDKENYVTVEFIVVYGLAYYPLCPPISGDGFVD